MLSVADKAFLLDLTDELADIKDPDKLGAAACRIIGRRLGARAVILEELGASQNPSAAYSWQRGSRPTAFRANWAEEQSAEDLLSRTLADITLLETDQGFFYSEQHPLARTTVRVSNDSVSIVATLLLNSSAKEGEPDLALLTEATRRSWAAVEHVRSETSLQKGRAVLAAFLEHASVGMYLKTFDGRFLMANEQMECFLGAPSAELIGRNVADVCGHGYAQMTREWEKQVLESGQGVAWEHEIASAEGTKWCLSVLFPVPATADAPPQIGGIEVDITKQKRAEAELAATQVALAQSEKLKGLGSLLAGVSHELNNPLSVVVGQSLMLEEKAADERTAQRAAKIRSAAERCSRIVRTFLAMARQRQPERRMVDLHNILRDVVDLIGYGARAASVDVRLNITENPMLVLGDPDQLHQVFANLLLNAQQAVEQQSGRREVVVTVSAADVHTLVDVVDSGPGIAPNIKNRIFDPFFTTKPSGEGTGIGLSYAQGVVANHGGELLVLPSAQGAHLRVVLPQAKLPYQEPITPRPAQLAKGSSRNAVLIIDHDHEQAHLVSEMLGLRRFVSCEVATTVRAAKRRLKQRLYDIIICNVRFPDFEGAKLLKWLARHCPAQVEQLAFITGDTLGPSVEFLRQSGRPYLEKPLSGSELDRLVDEILVSRNN